MAAAGFVAYRNLKQIEGTLFEIIISILTGINLQAGASYPRIFPIHADHLDPLLICTSQARLMRIHSYWSGRLDLGNHDRVCGL